MTTPAQPSFSPARAQPPGPQAAEIRCYICLNIIDTDQITYYQRDDQGQETKLDLSTITDRVQLGEVMRTAVVHCPSGHVLPADCVRYEPPVVVGLVGSRSTGKSTLLATMINEIDKNGLRDYGFRATPLTQDRHEEYRKGHVDPLHRHRQPLANTAPASEAIDFADGVLLIRDRDLRQPVIFFDVGGETFENAADRSEADTTRFIQAFSALLFVVDANRLAAPGGYEDQAFRIVQDRINPKSGEAEEYLDKPAAIVLAKADVLRFEPPVARWLGREDRARKLNPARIREESRDIFAFLYQRNAEWSLTPFDVFKKCTLHVVSATGSNAVKVPSGNSQAGGGEYIRDLRPRRVLEPLLSILAMTGVIGTSEAAQVGR